MAVAFDTSGTANTASSVTTFTSNFSIGAALSNGAMVACLITNSGTTSAPSMTWNGVAMTLIASTSIHDTGAGDIYLFGLVNPTGGGPHALAASWTGSTNAMIGFWSFSGVDQTGGATTFKNGITHNNAGANATNAMSVTTVAGDACVCASAGGQAFSGTQTPAVDFQHNVGGQVFGEGQHILSVGTSDSFTTTITAADVILQSACDLHAATGASTPVGFYEVWADPIRTKMGLATSSQQTLAFVSLVFAPGTGNILWYQPLSVVMIQNIIIGDG